MNKILLWAIIACLVGALAIGLVPRYMRPRCTAEVTKISAVQGSGDRSPLVGETVTVEGVVVANFSEPGGLSGYFVQEEDRDADDDPLTSEGIFVYQPDAGLKVGDIVCVTGRVAEYQGLTELKDVSQVAAWSFKDVKLPSPVEVALPFPDNGWLERVEGMRVQFPQELTVTDTYALGRYGEVTLSNGRLYCPTEVATPGAEAKAYDAENAHNHVILDDGISLQNPDPIVYPSPCLLYTSPSPRDS